MKPYRRDRSLLCHFFGYRYGFVTTDVRHKGTDEKLLIFCKYIIRNIDKCKLIKLNSSSVISKLFPIRLFCSKTNNYSGK